MAKEPASPESIFEAFYFANAFAAGIRPPFPHLAVRDLLSSDDRFHWVQGLYLISHLPAEEIAARYFESPGTYGALGEFLAAGAADSVLRSPDPLEKTAAFSNRDPFEYFSQWKMPSALMQVTLDRFSEISRALADTARIQPDHNGRPRIACIVHGTWAATEMWWRPTVGSFWRHVKNAWPHLYAGPSPFCWSGKNDHQSRVTAAAQLIRWRDTHAADAELDLIAHSHGGNVCIEAARQGLTINKLVLLGTPIRTEYMLSLANISSIRNVFSLGDVVQTPFATGLHRRFEGRTLGDATQVMNRRAEVPHGHHPNHRQLHDPAVWQACSLDDVLL